MLVRKGCQDINIRGISGLFYRFLLNRQLEFLKKYISELLGRPYVESFSCN